ncbi:MAG: hypothetical protein WA620_02560 [Methylovirgula sp.]
MGEDLDVAILGRLDLKGRLKCPAVVPCDGDIFAFREDDGGERSDQLADHVAARRQNRERGIGERFAAGTADKLQRHDGGAMAQRRVGELAGLDAQVGAHHRVGRVGDPVRAERADPRGIEQGGDDVIGPFRQADDVARFGVGEDQLGLRIAALGNIDRDRQFGGIDWLVAEHRDDSQSAGVEDEPLARRLVGDDHPFCHSGEPHGRVHDIGAIGKRKGRGCVGGLGDEPMRTVGLRRFIEDPPDQSAAHRLGVGRTEKGGEQ